MRHGTHIKLSDGRVGTVIYNSLIGEGIVWGLHNPNPRDFEGTNGDTVSNKVPEHWQWEPEALLKEPWDGCEKHGFTKEQCVGNNYEVIGR